MERSILIALVLLSFFPLVNADIISLNDAGDSSLVLTPNEPIEGFFFGESTTQNASEQGGLSPYEFDSGTVCKLAKEIDYKTLTGLNALKQALYDETGHLINQDKLENILPQCKPIKVFPFYIFLFLFVLALSLLTYFNRKRLLLLMHEYKKKSSKSKSPDILRDLPKTKQ